MGDNNYSKGDQSIINVLKYQNDELKKMADESAKERPYVNAQIEFLEFELRKRGVNLDNLKKHGCDNKGVMVVPSWENLCREAESAVGNHCKLESILSEDEIKSCKAELKMINSEFDQIHSLDKVDVMISSLAGIVGAAVDILLVGIPEKTPEGLRAGLLSNLIRDRFNSVFPEDEMEKLANKKISKVPYDAQDNRNTTEYVEGLSAYYHRLLSLGHDPLLGFVVGVFDILNGKMTTIDKKGSLVSQTMENYSDRKEVQIFMAISKQFIHLKSDVTTSMGLPAPLMGLFNLFQFGSIGEENQTIAEIVQGMYYQGYDFIHFCSLSIPVMVIEVIVRLSYAIKRIKEGHSVKESIPISLDHMKHPKLGTMLFVAHSEATAINAGKVFFTRNPLAINYPQWLAFAKRSFFQLKWAVIEKPYAREAYINGVLDERWKEVMEEIDAGFNDFSEGYTVVFE